MRRPCVFPATLVAERCYPHRFAAGSAVFSRPGNKRVRSTALGGGSAGTLFIPAFSCGACVGLIRFVSFLRSPPLLLKARKFKYSLGKFALGSNSTLISASLGSLVAHGQCRLIGSNYPFKWLNSLWLAVSFALLPLVLPFFRPRAAAAVMQLGQVGPSMCAV